MLTVKKLIETLSKLNPNARVEVEYEANDGCETCGHGASRLQTDVKLVIDLETRVVLSIVG